MADIHIRREHGLGLAKARKTAWRWAELAEEKFGLSCTVVEGATSDVIEFSRAGVDGRLVVSADAFDVTARLGFLLGAFRDRIESGIEDNLDAVLAQAAAAPKKKAAGKAAAKKKG